MDALLRHVSRLKHDLGKYVALQTRWLHEGATADARLEALRADLLHTRRDADQSVSAPAVWAELRPALVGEAPLEDGSRVDLSQDEDVVTIERCLAEVAASLGALRAGPDATQLAALERCARATAEACQSLHRRVSARQVG